MVLSTEDDEIAQIGRQLGLDVPFIRPGSLAEDNTPTFPVVIHAIETLEKLGDRFDAVCLLQPTNPLRRSDDIDACIRLLEESGADSVITVRQVPDEYNPNWVFWKNGDGRMRLSNGNTVPTARRQELPPAFHRDGSVYVSRCSSLRSHGNLYGEDIRGYEAVAVDHVNIDTLGDWEAATALLQQHRAVTGGLKS